MSQACKAQPPAVLWGAIHLQSYLKGLLLSRQKFVMDYSTAKGAKRKMLTMWEPTKSFDIRKRFHTSNSVNPNLGFAVTWSGLTSAHIS